MKISSQKVNDMSVISIVGSIDGLTAPELTEFIKSQIETGETNLVIDLDQVNFMSSAGLRAILTGLKSIRDQGGEIYLAAPQPGIEKTLRISGFNKIIKIFPTFNEAIASYHLK